MNRIYIIHFEKWPEIYSSGSTSDSGVASDNSESDSEELAAQKQRNWEDKWLWLQEAAK